MIKGNLAYGEAQNCLFQGRSASAVRAFPQSRGQMGNSTLAFSVHSLFLNKRQAPKMPGCGYYLAKEGRNHKSEGR